MSTSIVTLHLFTQGIRMATSRKSYHHGDLRQSLLSTAEHLLEHNGVGAVSLREVAKAAGVSHTAPYRHFTDKNSLLAALATIGFGRLADAVDQCVVKHPGDPVAQLSAAAHAYIDLATQHPQMTNLMFGGVLNKDECAEELKVESERSFNSLLNVIQNGLEAKLYIEKDKQELALFAWSYVHGFSMLISAGQLGEMSNDEHTITALVNTLNQMLLNGIAKK